MEAITESFEELKSEARDLGINIKSMKTKKDVKSAIDKHYENQSADGLVKFAEEDENGDEENKDTSYNDEYEDVIEDDIKEPMVKKTKGTKNEKKVQNKNKNETYEEIIKSKPDFSSMSKSEAKRASAIYHKRLKNYWTGKRVVTITNNDKRENAHATMAFLSAGVIQREVPLDIPIELEKCLINVAKNLTMTAHVDEIINGVRTGNKTPVVVKKYGVSLQDTEL